MGEHLFGNCRVASCSGAGTIAARELLQRIEGRTAPRIVDVREPGEFAAGHVPGAENIPLSRLPGEYHRLGQGEEIVLVCRSGNRSARAQQFLIRQGYTRTRNLTGGMAEWPGPVES